MSKRSEIVATPGAVVNRSYWQALRQIYAAVRGRRKLIYGKLRDGCGGTCALGAFWDDNRGAIIESALIEEVATINDAIPLGASEYKRREFVKEWLRIKLRSHGDKV